MVNHHKAQRSCNQASDAAELMPGLRGLLTHLLTKALQEDLLGSPPGIMVPLGAG